jgi:hypothetical protein
MWLFTRYGFFPLACAQRADNSIDPDNFMVRARRKTHLRNLQARFEELATTEVITLPIMITGIA